MYEYQLSRHLACERRMELLRFAEEARRIAEAEKMQLPKKRNLLFSGISHLLRGLLAGSSRYPPIQRSHPRPTVHDHGIGETR